MEPIDENYPTNPIQKIIQWFSDLPPAKKIVLYLAIGFILITAVVTLSFMGKDTDTQQTTNKEEIAQIIPTTKPVRFQPTRFPTATPEPTAVVVDSTTQTSLSIETEKSTMKVGEEQTISVNLGDIPVAAVDVILTYNPQVVEISDLQNGQVFERIIRNQIESGRVIYSASIAPENKDNIAIGKVFSVKVKALKNIAETPIDFNPQETITALAGRNTLGMARGTKLVID